MSYFDLKPHIKSERFRATTDEGAWDAGQFDYEILLENVTDHKINILCDWLVDNCTYNFIFNREISEIIAGGTSNNKRMWERRKKTGQVIYSHPTINAYLRLDRDDSVAFRLTWIL